METFTATHDRTLPRVEPADGGGSARRLSARLVAYLEPDERTLILDGELDTAASRPLRHMLRALVHECTPGMVVVVDVTDVTVVDAGGLAALVVGQRLAAARRCVFALRLPSDDVRAALSAHRLEGTFEIVH
jgi:ABC-type transporter Mla MlaB component